jgi:hypothetical protein
MREKVSLKKRTVEGQRIYSDRRSSWGSFAIFAAIRRASSLLSRLAAERRPEFIPQRAKRPPIVDISTGKYRKWVSRPEPVDDRLKNITLSNEHFCSDFAPFS